MTHLRLGRACLVHGHLPLLAPPPSYIVLNSPQTMSLRRLAANNAASPRVRKQNDTTFSPSSSSTPPTVSRTPTTPRTSISYPISPETLPSLSASVPFDWEAARLRKPPPYASPLQNARVRARKSDVQNQNRTKRFVRKKSIIER